jgi:hypothetical protein
MAIINLQQRNVAVAPPKNQASLLAVGIYRQSISDYSCTTPGIRLEIQARTPAIASFADAQLFDWAKAIGCYISHSRIIQ